MKKIVEKVKQYIRDLFSLFPTLYIIQLYVKNRHRLPNLKNPRDLSEIIFSEVLNHQIEQYAPYADKIEVRRYIEEWGLGEYLPKLYDVWDNAEDICIENLPEKFALKTNHGCGSHIFCRKKSEFNLVEAKEKMRSLLSQSYGSFLEPHYKLIQPKVYAEEFLEEKGCAEPADYKFMCCDGKVRFIFVVKGRGSKKGTKYIAYNQKWERLDYIKGKKRTDTDIPAPTQHSLQKMIAIAEQIASHFVHVRVDLYYIEGRIIIGELTFTPQSGVMCFFNNAAIEAAGHV